MPQQSSKKILEKRPRVIAIDGNSCILLEFKVLKVPDESTFGVNDKQRENESVKSHKSVNDKRMS
jgi:hypothetical protein